MKKFVYLCGMMLLSLNVMAQIDLNDNTWKRTFCDDFTASGRYWQEDWLSSDKKWRGYSGMGVTTKGGFEVTQYANSIFCPAEEKIKLVARYCDTICNNTYPLPGWIHDYPPCDSLLFYFSGEIDARKDSILDSDLRFQYGYFEILCKLPKNPGAHTAFWLHGASQDTMDPYYEEIDVFEYSWSYGDPNVNWHAYNNPKPTYPGDPRVFSTAIVHNFRGDTVNFDTDVYGMNYPQIPLGQGDIGEWHTYSCEWMPDHVYWYFDGRLVNSYYDKIHIPKHPLVLKTNYAINDYAVKPIKDTNNSIIGYEPDWTGSDTMHVDYIKVYQLKWKCSEDVVITCQNDLENYEYNVKNSVSINSTNGNVVLSNTDKITFRVADSLEITGPFQADSGCEFTVIRQDCPE